MKMTYCYFKNRMFQHSCAWVSLFKKPQHFRASTRCGNKPIRRFLFYTLHLHALCENKGWEENIGIDGGIEENIGNICVHNNDTERLFSTVCSNFKS